MRIDDIPLPLLLGAVLFSCIVIRLGVGFAGGIDRAFTLPSGSDPASVVLWVFAWALIIAPLILAIWRLLRWLLKPRHDGKH